MVREDQPNPSGLTARAYLGILKQIPNHHLIGLEPTKRDCESCPKSGLDLIAAKDYSVPPVDHTLFKALYILTDSLNIYIRL